MRKIHILVAFAAIISSVSCQKEETPILETGNDPVFSATIDNSTTKTIVNGTKIVWELYDEIKITDASSTSVIYQVKFIDSDGTATFVKKAGEASTLGDGPYTAVFEPTIPTYQVEGSTLTDLPMSASSETTTLHFTVTCGILKISIAPMDKKIIRTLVRNENVTSNNTFILNSYGGGSGISLAEGATFEIIVPAATYTYFNFIMSDGTGAEKRAQSVTVEPNHIKPIKVETMDFKPTYIIEDQDYIGVGVSVAGYIWAPVNCGYTSNTPKGLHYQWAKKYGFATTGDVSKTKDRLEYMSEGINYTSFIYGLTRQCWYKKCSNHDEWKEDKDYDPCPDGWRVPTDSEVYGLCSASHKWITNGTIEGKGKYYGVRIPSSGEPSIFLPSVGYRDFADAKVNSSDSFAAYWSKSPGGTEESAVSIHFSENSTLFDNHTERSNGYSLRCVHK